jgi:putative ABC transport system ATP-binding protein
LFTTRGAAVEGRRSEPPQRRCARSTALVQLCDVVKVYRTAAGEVRALNGITTEFYRGEFAGIVGRSGAGKSTLVNMITGVDDLTSGQVYVDDTCLGELDENQIASWRGRNVGVVYQSFELLPMLSLLDNVMLPMDFCALYRRGASPERAMVLLGQVGLEEHALKRPAQISGGQKQRVAIARALANDPPIIVADEPTGNLDSATAEEILVLFEDLVSQGKTVIMVTHDSSLAPRFSRLLRIDDGEIVEDVTRSHAVDGRADSLEGRC